MGGAADVEGGGSRAGLDDVVAVGARMDECGGSSGLGEHTEAEDSTRQRDDESGRQRREKQQRRYKTKRVMGCLGTSSWFGGRRRGF